MPFPKKIIHPHLPKDLISSRDLSTNVVRLNGNLLDLAVLDDDRISLASVCAQHWRSGELEIPCSGEGSVCVTKESNSGRLVGIKGLAPCVHAAGEVSARFKEGFGWI